jgi:hypothetical protein
MNANKEKGANKDKSVCGYNESARLRYFHGMLLDDKDFTVEQEYHVKKRRFLNRMLHGSGVVCGLELRGEKGGRWIDVTPGLALDCAGNEIWVPQAKRVELASLLPPKDKGQSKECEEEVEPQKDTYYIGIRYDEKPSNPVSVYLPSGSCEERTCENSRYKEGFCIEVAPCCREKSADGLLKKFCGCPEEFNGEEELKKMVCPSCDGLENKQLCQCLELEKFCERSVPCPECGSCEKPCHVVLGKIEVNDDGSLAGLCNNECRSYVLTGRLLQHMLLGVLVGSETYFHMEVGAEKIPLPNVGDPAHNQNPIAELVHNPIKALGWFLRYGLIEGGKFRVNLCGEDADRPDRPPSVETQVSEVHAQVRSLAANNLKLTTELNQIREEARLNIQRLENLVKQPVTEKAAAIEKETAAEKVEAEDKEKEEADKKSTKSPKTPK